MKKLFLFFVLVAFFTIDATAQRKPMNNANIAKTVQMPRDQQSTQQNARSHGRTLYWQHDGYVNRGYYYNIYHNKHDIRDYYKYEVEVYVYQGNPDLYIYGEGGNKREIRYSRRHGSQTEVSYYKLADLRSHERSIVLGIYGNEYSKFKIKIYKVYEDPHNQCHYSDPVNDLHWLRNIKNQYPNYKICEYKYNGKTYFQVYRCGISHYTEYWYNCEGHKVCEFNNGHPCNEVRHAELVKCWYDPCYNGGCVWNFWYDDCQDHKEIPAGSDYYVKVNAQKHQDIQWMELYMDGHKIRRENSYPYEWGRPNDNQDHRLRNLKPGTYRLKCVVYDKCEKYYEKYCTIVVKDKHCNKNAWYEYGKHNTHYNRGQDVYVRVKPEKQHDIEWMELYINGHKIRKENSYPYEWGRPNDNQDHQLRNMHAGRYELKCIYKTKCGKEYYKTSTIYVD